MGIRVLIERGVHGRAVLYDSVTDVPLPMEMFASDDDAHHFLMWANEQEREPFLPGDFYDAGLLKEAYSDWYDQHHTEDGDLTDEAIAQLYDGGINDDAA